MNNEQKLNALLALYDKILEDIRFYQEQGDSTGIMNVIPVVIIPILQLFNVDGFIIACVCLFVPCIQMLSLQRGLQAHKFVAMLRGYASSIEININKLLMDKQFLYNSYLIDKYIASDRIVRSRGLKTSMFVTYLMHGSILVVCIGFFVYFNTFRYWYVYLFAFIWFLVFSCIIAKLCIDFAKKEQKRYEAKDFCQNINNQQ